MLEKILKRKKENSEKLGLAIILALLLLKKKKRKRRGKSIREKKIIDFLRRKNK